MMMTMVAMTMLVMHTLARRHQPHMCNITLNKQYFNWAATGAVNNHDDDSDDNCSDNDEEENDNPQTTSDDNPTRLSS